MVERPEDPNNPIFWESRYRQGNTGWDLGQPAPPFVGLLSEPDAPPPSPMIVLGCGRGHDAVFFAQHGFQVTAVDFARPAIEDAQRAAHAASVDINFVQHDLFTLPPSFDHQFAYMLEHTCFSAIPPDRREEYAQLGRRLLAPEGLYIALFFAHGKPGGPPFNTTASEIRTLFSPYFSIQTLQPPSRSVEQRQGEELFALMRPLSGGEAA